MYVIMHMLGLLGAVLVVQSDSSRREGPAINYKQSSLCYNNVVCLSV